MNTSLIQVFCQPNGLYINYTGSETELSLIPTTIFQQLERALIEGTRGDPRFTELITRIREINLIASEYNRPTNIDGNPFLVEQLQRVSLAALSIIPNVGCSTGELFIACRKELKSTFCSLFQNQITPIKGREWLYAPNSAKKVLLSHCHLLSAIEKLFS